MPMTLNRQIPGGVVLDLPYYVEYLQKNGGQLPQDMGAHALWHYYVTARLAYEQIVLGETPVYEGERDGVFRPMDIMRAISMLYGLEPDTIAQYWDAVERQRRALGLSSNADLPEQYKFKSNMRGRG